MTKSFTKVDDSPILKFIDMLNQTNAIARNLISHPKVKKLLSSNEKFDLVISELALNEALLGKFYTLYITPMLVFVVIAQHGYRIFCGHSTGFSEYYNCPHILISTVGATTWVSTVTGNPIPLSYAPHVFLDMTDKMNLFERLENTIFHIAENVLMNLYFYGVQQEIYETEFPNGRSFRPFQDKMKNGVSLVSCNIVTMQHC